MTTKSISRCMKTGQSVTDWTLNFFHMVSRFSLSFRRNTFVLFVRTGKLIISWIWSCSKLRNWVRYWVLPWRAAVAWGLPPTTISTFLVFLLKTTVEIHLDNGNKLYGLLCSQVGVRLRAARLSKFLVSSDRPCISHTLLSFVSCFSTWSLKGAVGACLFKYSDSCLMVESFIKGLKGRQYLGLSWACH